MPFPALVDRRGALTALGLAATVFVGGSAAASDDPDAFQREVLDILHESFPERAFTPGKDAEEIVSGAQTLFLGNLRATVAGLPQDKRRVEIIHWFALIVAGLDKDEDKDWATAQPLLRPKLVTRGYLQTYPDMMSRPFLAGLLVAAAVDLGQRDEYVLSRMLKVWGVSEDAVHGRAIANLEDMSRDIELAPRKLSGGSGVYVAVNKGDAYDAGRLLLPQFRERLLGVLGTPAFAGVPNRDFLIAWSKGLSAQDGFIAQIGKDSRSQPYSLTDAIFRIDHDGIRVAMDADLKP